MKKSKRKLLFGAAIASGTIFTACSLRPQNVYGPPVNIPEAVYGPPSYWDDPDNNIPEDVYGPPSYWGGPEEPEVEETRDAEIEEVEEVVEVEEVSEAAPAEDPSFDVEENMNVAVYGPPEYFESIAAEKENLSATPKAE